MTAPVNRSGQTVLEPSEGLALVLDGLDYGYRPTVRAARERANEFGSELETTLAGIAMDRDCRQRFNVGLTLAASLPALEPPSAVEDPEFEEVAF